MAPDALDRPRRLALITRPQDRPLAPGRHVNWQVWAQANRGHSSLWRTFLAEQRALVRELDELVTSIPSVKAPVRLLADPKDMLVPVGLRRPCQMPASSLSKAPVITCPDELPLPSPTR